MLLALILVPATGIAYLLTVPRLVQVSPQPEAANVPANAALSLTFSRWVSQAEILPRLTVSPTVEGSYSVQGKTLTFQAKDAWPNGTRIQIQLQPGARAAGWPRLATREHASWSFTIGQPHLVYLYPADGPSNLYLLNPFTGEAQQLSDSSGGVLDFDVVESLNSIFFSANGPAGSSSIYRLPGVELQETTPGTASNATPESQLGKAEQVVPCPQARCRAPRVSPQGDFLAYEQTAFPGQENPSFPQVWLLPLENGLAQPGKAPALAGPTDHQTLQPQWSPEGLLTFYDTNLSAFTILDPHSGETRHFPNQTGYPGSWDPAGERYTAPEITFPEGALRENAPVGISHLIEYQLNQDATQDLSGSEVVEDAFPAYSPDGARLAFARRYLDTVRWTPGRQLWLMQADGTQPQAMTDDPFHNYFDFTWSPDGKQLAFVRFHQTELTEPPEIWMMEAGTASSRRLVSGGYSPQWLP